MTGVLALGALTPGAIVLARREDHLTLEEYIKNDIRLTRFAHYGSVTGRWKHSAVVVYRDGRREVIEYGRTP